MSSGTRSAADPRLRRPRSAGRIATGVLAASVWTALATTARAQADGRYFTYLLLHRVGSESFTMVGDPVRGGRLAVVSRLSDRGTVRGSSTEFAFGPGLAVTRLENRREGAATPTILTTVLEGRVDVEEGGTSRRLVKPTLGFPGMTAMPASLQAAMLDYWRQHGRPVGSPC